MMRSNEIYWKKPLKLLILLWLALFMSACAKGPPILIHANHYTHMEQDDINQEIDRLESLVEKNRENPETYFRLATLYAHPANAFPRYEQSLIMLNRYCAREPDSLKNDEVLFMKNLLEKIVAAGKRQAQLALEATEVQEQNAALANRNASLAEKNRDLNDTIEKLKLLDLRLETRRLNLK